MREQDRRKEDRIFAFQKEIEHQGWAAFIDVVLPDGNLENFGPLPQDLKYVAFGQGPLYHSEYPDFQDCMVFSSHLFVYDPKKLAVSVHEDVSPAELKAKVDEFRKQKYGIAAGTLTGSRIVKGKGGREKNEIFETGKIIAFRPL